MIEGAVFDLDGTLLDTMGMWSEVINIYLRSLGKEPKPDLMDTIWNMGLTQAGTFCKEDYDLSLTVPEIVQGILDQVSDFYRYEARPMPYVKEFLDALAAKGVRMTVATASDHQLIGEALERLGMRHHFSQILDCAEAGHGKDEPIIYRMALEHLGTSKEKTLVFEDATYAVDTLKKDGFLAVGIYSPYEKDKDKVRQLADTFIESYDQLNEFWQFAESL